MGEVSNSLSNTSIDLLAVSPCDASRAADLIREIGSQNRDVPSLSNSERLELLKASRSLTRALETPIESIGRSCWVEPTLYTAINTAISLGLFAMMAKADAGSSTIKGLADLTGVDPDLLSRLMRHMAAMEVVLETGPDQYKLTNFSRTLAVPKYADGFPCIASSAAPALYKLPEYLARNGYKVPTKADDSPFTYAYNTSETWFSWLEAHPTVYNQFNNHMTAYHEGRPSWMDADFYPVQQQLVYGARTDAEAVLMVDVGGGLGHDLVEFHGKHPETPGRLVVQDLPNVIGTIQNLDKAIEPMAHDFFTEQPIKGARAYYLHSVLHNWPDDACLRILAPIAAAMEFGYSKILISEPVIPKERADPQLTGLDIMMMSLYSARERNEEHWKQLLGEAGLKIRKIWSHSRGFESLIECELV